MGIHDAQVEVTCDGDGCAESVFVTPEYVYTSYSGSGGHYDTSVRAIHEKVEAEGWTVDGEQTYCEGCRGDANDDSDSDDGEDQP